LSIPPPGAHCALHSFPTRRSSDLGRTIADVLDMSVQTALEFFQHIPKVRRRLETLEAVGLGYVRLGQPATTLSGGEAQRVKLARSEEHTSELQSLAYLVCRLLLEK